MPIRGAKAIRDLIYYQYAKIIARSAFKVADGKKAKEDHFGFINNTFKDLKAGKKQWLEMTREDRRFIEVEKRCVYCAVFRLILSIRFLLTFL